MHPSDPDKPSGPTPDFRHARRHEVPAIVALLADDILGRDREAAAIQHYLDAFDRIQAEGANHLIVAVIADDILGCYQLTFISGLSLSATRRAQIEGVRVAPDWRGRGLGHAMLQDAESRACAAGCSLLQFTTNKARHDAHRFYERMGFTPSHIGYKKAIRASFSPKYPS
ncbi:GNAT family N-acetyltransferase [Paracoccus sp. Z330]|uniref:GNAT family N-acetyltransferase n=1 Tax=Paracoccus onchidii TaxID=3017813 RepID=A0ABT4ZF18_9RHOB|nr:GNAT family N-acetyltransferase [Paracoccus onchidii]MDB6177971.1 GNAT family N-acetyltransferase [Paracoccus onchidii]